jgi:hypothetical protein
MHHQLRYLPLCTLDSNQPASDFVYCAGPVNLGELPSLGVLGNDCRGLLVVKTQAVADDDFVVVAAAGLLGPAEEAVGTSSSSSAVSCRTMTSFFSPVVRISSR